MFTLADSAFAYACNSWGPNCVAASATVEFWRPAYGGERLRAVATERDMVGRRGVYDVDVRRDDGTLIVRFRGISSRLSEPTGGQ